MNNAFLRLFRFAADRSEFNTSINRLIGDIFSLQNVLSNGL